MELVKQLNEEFDVPSLFVSAQVKKAHSLDYVSLARKRFTPEEIFGTLRDELLNREFFYSLKEVQILIGRWYRLHNSVLLHSALGYAPLAPVTIIPGDQIRNRLTL